MSQPVKLSDGLVLDARLTCELAQRSIAGQIEFWARMGRAMEPMLQGVQSMALCRSGAANSLSDCLASVDTKSGQERVASHLETLPFPHYEASDQPGMLVRIEADGNRTLGRFVRRKFQPAKTRSARR